MYQLELFRLLREAVKSTTQNSLLCNKIMTQLEYERQATEPNMESVKSFLVDAIWVMDIELEPGLTLDSNGIPSSIERKQLAVLITDLVTKSLLSMQDLEERLDLNLLELVGVIDSASIVQRRTVRINTTMLYKQQKFNLIREETEGFSKLVNEMCSNQCMEIDSDQIGSVLQDINALIAYFDLDPNRVLDIVFDLMIINVIDYWRFYIELLKQSPWKPPSESGSNNKSQSLCSQILGFKFSFYKSQDLPTPRNLYITCAILIQHEIVKMDLLYSYLESSATIQEQYQLYIKSLKQKSLDAGRFTSNALMGVLDDEPKDKFSSSQKKTEQIPVVEPFNGTKILHPKAGLAFALLLVGSFNQSKIILDHHLEISLMHPDIALAICRILNYKIHSFYNTVRPPLPRSSPSNINLKLLKQPINTSNINLCHLDEGLRIGRRPTLPTYVFFYKDWVNELVECSNISECLETILFLLPYIGAHLHRDIKTATKIVRLGAFHLQQSGPNDVLNIKTSWTSILSRYLFPTIAQLNDNPAFTNEIFEILKQYNYEARFSLYAEWHQKTYDLVPELKVSKAGCIKDTRYIMRRLSKETVREYGRHIGKVAHSNPTIVFSIIIDQLQSYDNQIPHVVDASRYLTDLEFDILSYCMVEALSNSRKERIQPSGTLISKWLAALATFCGTLWRKHTIELRGLLIYVARQLANNNVYDLVVLQELIGQMSGIKIIDEATDQQLDSFAGGELLRRESLMFENIRTIKKCSNRLIQALSESNLVFELSILLGQQRRDIIYSQKQASDLKIIGWMFDHCHKSLLQYYDFLSLSLDRQSYTKLFSNLDDLIFKYQLEPEVAFYFIRPSLNRILKKYNSETWPEMDSMISSPTRMELDSPAELVQSEGFTPILDQIWHPALQEFVKIVEKMFPETVFNVMSSGFYMTFWQFSLYDISIPKERYESEIKKNNLSVLKIDYEIKSDQALTSSSSSMSRKRKEKDRIIQMNTQLEKELEYQIVHHEKVMSRLAVERKQWFALTSANQGETVNTVIQYCVLPRVLFSPQDSIFVSRFLTQMQVYGTFNWHSVMFYDKILSKALIQSILFSCSENEARNFGLFIGDVLKTLTLWHKNNELYNQQCVGDNLCGFMKSDQQNHYTWDEYRKLTYRWHIRLKKMFESCFESKEYMQTRNSIIMLDKIRESFPLVRVVGNEIEKMVKLIEETEERGDLKQLARSYYAKLQGLKVNWMSIKDFSNLSDLSINLSDMSNDKTNTMNEVNVEPLSATMTEEAEVNQGQVNNPAVISTIEIKPIEPTSILKPILRQDSSQMNIDVNLVVDKSIKSSLLSKPTDSWRAPTNITRSSTSYVSDIDRDWRDKRFYPIKETKKETLVPETKVEKASWEWTDAEKAKTSVIDSDNNSKTESNNELKPKINSPKVEVVIPLLNARSNTPVSSEALSKSRQTSATDIIKERLEQIKSEERLKKSVQFIVPSMAIKETPKETIKDEKDVIIKQETDTVEPRASLIPVRSIKPSDNDWTLANKKQTASQEKQSIAFVSNSTNRVNTSSPSNQIQPTEQSFIKSDQLSNNDKEDKKKIEVSTEDGEVVEVVKPSSDISKPRPKLITPPSFRSDGKYSQDRGSRYSNTDPRNEMRSDSRNDSRNDTRNESRTQGSSYDRTRDSNKSTTSTTRPARYDSRDRETDVRRNETNRSDRRDDGNRTRDFETNISRSRDVIRFKSGERGENRDERKRIAEDGRDSYVKRKRSYSRNRSPSRERRGRDYRR